RCCAVVGGVVSVFFFFQGEDGIRDWSVTGVQTCALPISLERLDIVEFVPNVIRAARFFPEVNHGVLDDRRARVTIDDGRHFLLRSEERRVGKEWRSRGAPSQ